MVSTVNFVLAVGAVLLQVFLFVVIFAWFIAKEKPESSFGKFLRYVTVEKGILLSFLVALSGLILSLFYSEFAGYTPCVLCWYQRIALYPQVLILGLALWRKETAVRIYSISLSVLGAIVALYNTYLQFGGNPLIPCDAAASCSQRFVFEFGYITIPTMSLTAFLFIAVILWMGKKIDSRLMNHD